jgi:hypothetical protein
MASGKYELLSQLLLNALFNGGSFSFPATIYVPLFSVTPSVSSTGTEATGSGYARLAITANTTNFPTISGSTTTISLNTSQSYAAATGDWSSAANQVAAGIAVSLAGALSSNLYYWGLLTEAKPVLNGDTASFASGALTVQEL